MTVTVTVISVLIIAVLGLLTMSLSFTAMFTKAPTRRVGIGLTLGIAYLLTSLALAFTVRHHTTSLTTTGLTALAVITSITAVFLVDRHMVRNKNDTQEVAVP